MKTTQHTNYVLNPDFTIRFDPTHNWVIESKLEPLPPPEFTKWFDTGTNTVKSWNGERWIVVALLYATAKVENHTN